MRNMHSRKEELLLHKDSASFLCFKIFMKGSGEYMVVAHNPIVKKAISKEKLTKRGLISLSDYYLKVAHS